MMRIVHVIPDLGTGGAERIAGALAMASRKQGLEASVISLWPPRGSQIEEELRAAGCPTFYLNKKPGLEFRISMRLSDSLKALRPNIVHSHRFALRYLAPLLARKSSVPVVHTLHNIATKEAGTWDRLLYWNLFRTRVCPVAISTAVRRSVAQTYRLQFVPLVHNGVDLEALRMRAKAPLHGSISESVEEGDVIFAAVGRLAPQKNHKLLIESFAAARKVGLRRAKLLIVGDGPLRDELRAQVAARGLCRSILFLGLRRDVPALLAACDFLILSSDWEGHPLTVLEALAVGTPVISTDVGGVADSIIPRRNGMLVRRGSVRELSFAILQACSLDVRRRLREGARTFDVRMTSAHMCMQYEGIYAQALEGGVAHARVERGRFTSA